MRAFGMAVNKTGAARPVLSGAFAALAAKVVVIAMVASSPAHALDANNASPPPEKISPETFTSAQQALRVGVDDLQNGDAQSSIKALTYAAEGGEPLARWKLGSMYASGEVVPRDDMLAYKYFDQLVDSYNEDDFDRRNAAAVSNAFVAVGLYNLNGIPNSDIKPDPERALEMFQVAATDFGDPEAQYRLAKMYMEGAGGLARDNMRAARWLGLASEKGHHGAQAVLGHLLFTGDGVPRQRARGLMWLAVANAGAKGPKDAWIRELRAKDYNASNDDDRQVAEAYLAALGKDRVASAPLPLPVFPAHAPAPPPTPPVRLTGALTAIAPPPPGQ